MNKLNKFLLATGLAVAVGGLGGLVISNNRSSQVSKEDSERRYFIDRNLSMLPLDLADREGVPDGIGKVLYDFDNDGDEDMIMAVDGNIVYFENNDSSKGKFGATIYVFKEIIGKDELNPYDSNAPMYLRDVNGDGRMDLIITRKTKYPVMIEERVFENIISSNSKK